MYVEINENEKERGRKNNLIAKINRNYLKDMMVLQMQTYLATIKPA